MSLEKDAAARHRLRTDLDASLLVEAAAGTGKTTILIERLVAVLSAGKTTVERLVAVTFTRKAAGELKLRLRQELDIARTRASGGGTEHQNLTAAIARLEEAHIGTIHSFCAELLRRRPVEAGVDPAFVEMDQEESGALYAQVFRTWIERRLEEMPDGLARILRRLALSPSFDGSSPLDRLRLAGRDLVDWRDFGAPWRLDDFPRESAENALVDRLDEINAMRRRGAPRDPLTVELQPIADLLDALKRTEEDAGRRDYDELEAQLLELLKALRRQRPRRGGTAEYAAGLLRKDVQAKRLSLIDDLEDFERRAGADLAARLHAELSEVLTAYDERKRALGRLDFLDLLIRCRQLLVESAEARRDFQDAFSHIFVDEFQDTDPLQAEILLLLSARDPQTTDWREVDPRPGSLLLVGDPKQSIYRFRRADVVFYQSVQERLGEVGVETLILSRSFRSPKPLQAALNAAFSRHMVEDRRAGQPAYVALDGELEADSDQPYLVGLPVPEPFGVRGWPTIQAIESSLPDTVAAWISWLLSSPFRVRDPESGERVPIRPHHICVLFRRYLTWGRDVTAPYLRGLESRGVPHVLVGGRTLHQREEVESLRAALAAIEWPDDTLAVYSTLRGVFFGFTDDRLLRFRAKVGHLDASRALNGGPGDGDGDSTEPLEEELGEVAEALETLAGWHRDRNEIPIAETINRLFEHSRAHATFALRPAGHQVLANVQRVVDMARAFEVRGGLSFRGFVERLDEAAAKPGSGTGPLVEEGAEGVRVMTVHSAKGLEFPVVVLGDLTCRLAPRDPGLHLDAENGLCARRILGLTPWELHENRDLEHERDRAESVRLAYVAATRARDLLALPGLTTRPWTDGWLSPLDEAIYPAKGSQAKPAPGCPEFGPSTLLVDPHSFGPGHGSPIRPGLHRSKAGTDIVWWDPTRLDLSRTGNFGVRHQNLLAPDESGEAFEEGLDRYLDWQVERDQALEAGGVPSREILTVTDTEQWPPVDIEVRHEGIRAADHSKAGDRPSGRRFGTLVHALMHDIDLLAPDGADSADAENVPLEALAKLHGRLLSCPEEEVEAGIHAVDAARSHALLRRAAEADRVCRETPFSLRLENDLVIQGTIDLAFSKDGRWTVVDFKTDIELEGRLEGYRRQIAWYAFALQELTGEPASGVLLSL